MARVGTLLRVAVTDFERAIARRFGEIRRKAGWTQERLADRIGIEPATLSRYETARRPIPLDVLGRAAAALGVGPAALFAGDRETLAQVRLSAGVERPVRPRDEREVLRVWAQLRPRDRQTVLVVGRQLARRAPLRSKSR